MVERVASTALHGATAAREWQAQVFRDKATGAEQLALVHGTLDPEQPVLVRMHSLDLFADVLGEAGERSRPAARARCAMIEAEGAGVVVALHAASPGSLSRADRPALGQAGREPARRCAATASARRSSPRSASTT